MYICDECNEDEQHSKYLEPIIVNSQAQNKIAHIECCSKESLLEKLKQIVASETMFYKDISDLVENFSKENISKIEKKYGSFDEYKSGIKSDKFTEILSIIDELKK
jgi:hypothetical protein